MQVLDDHPVVPVGQLARGDALLVGLHLDRRAVLVGAGDHEHVVAGHPHVPAEDVGGDAEAGDVADVARAVGVRPGDRRENVTHEQSSLVTRPGRPRTNGGCRPADRADHRRPMVRFVADTRLSCPIRPPGAVCNEPRDWATRERGTTRTVPADRRSATTPSPSPPRPGRRGRAAAPAGARRRPGRAAADPAGGPPPRAAPRRRHRRPRRPADPGGTRTEPGPARLVGPPTGAAPPARTPSRWSRPPARRWTRCRVGCRSGSSGRRRAGPHGPTATTPDDDGGDFWAPIEQVHWDGTPVRSDPDRRAAGFRPATPPGTQPPHPPPDPAARARRAGGAGPARGVLRLGQRRARSGSRVGPRRTGTVTIDELHRRRPHPALPGHVHRDGRPVHRPRRPASAACPSRAARPARALPAPDDRPRTAAPRTSDAGVGRAPALAARSAGGARRCARRHRPVRPACGPAARVAGTAARAAWRRLAGPHAASPSASWPPRW